MEILLIKLLGKLKACYVYFILYPLNFFILVPLFLLLKEFLFNKKDIKFVLMDAHKIGHMPLCVEPFIKKLYDKRVKKKHDFFYLIFFIKPISNSYFYSLIIDCLKNKNNVSILNNYLVWLYFCKIYRLITKRNILVTGTARRNFLKINNDQNMLIKIPNKDIASGEELIKKLGILKHTKWICVTNRDGKYLKSNFKFINSSYHNYRDFSISSMKKAIEYFISKNYYVVRLGQEVFEKLDIKNEMFIDYPFSPLKSDFLDVYLSAKCVFYFGSGAGISNVPRIFRRPMYMINQVPILSVFLHKNKLQTFKKLRNKKTKKILTIQEMLDNGLNSFSKSSYIEKRDIEVINNNEEEILSFAKEALTLHENNSYNTNNFKNRNDEILQDLIKNQQRFKSLFFTNKIGKHFLDSLKIYNV